MSEKNNQHITNASGEVARIMLRTLLSTSLRIFVPTTLLFVIGLIVDISCETKPWGMVVGTGLGILIAVGLILKQLKDIRAEAKAPKEKAGYGRKH